MPYADPADDQRRKRDAARDARAEHIRKHGPCVECGTWRNLEVDHIDPRRKVSSSIWTWGAARRLTELRKTQVLCKKHHKMKTRLEREPPHGTRSRYNSPVWRCRCGKCTAANTKYKRNLRK